MPTRFEDGLGYLVHHLMYTFRQVLSELCAQSGYAITSDELAVLTRILNNVTSIEKKLSKRKSYLFRTFADPCQSGFGAVAISSRIFTLTVLGVSAGLLIVRE